MPTAIAEYRQVEFTGGGGGRKALGCPGAPPLGGTANASGGGMREVSGRDGGRVPRRVF